MNQKKELKKIAKNTYPLLQYPFFEGRNYRKNLYNEMSAYWVNHPERSTEDIKDLFCEDYSDEVYTGNGIPKKVKICLILLGLLIFICVALFLFSSSWDAPSITTN